MATLLMISGSLRAASLNTKLVLEAGELWPRTTERADLNMPLYNGDDEKADGVPAPAQRLAEQIEAAAAVAIATPEYNQSFPGGLKNALDWVSRIDAKPWRDKPVAIMSAAAGRAGGARAQYALRLALNSFQPRLLTGPEVMVASAATEFDDDGRLMGERYKAALAELMAKLAKTAGL
ncbi:MAG: NADPH-dependent FMN reductase [Paracoccaceae bacterium]|nr:NADPH-dependent FMN reductase [Paracoccaceae bacterium]